jgi:hypothetical protein
MSFEWKLPLVDNKGRNIVTIKQSGNKAEYTDATYEDGKTETFWTENGHRYRSDAMFYNDPEYDRWVEPAPQPEPTDEEVAAKYRAAAKISIGLVRQLEERGFKFMHVEYGQVTFANLDKLEIVKEIKL